MRESTSHFLVIENVGPSEANCAVQIKLDIATKPKLRFLDSVTIFLRRIVLVERRVTGVVNDFIHSNLKISVCNPGRLDTTCNDGFPVGAKGASDSGYLARKRCLKIGRGKRKRKKERVDMKWKARKIEKYGTLLAFYPLKRLSFEGEGSFGIIWSRVHHPQIRY